MRDAGSLRDALLDRLAAQWIALGVALVGPADDTLVDIEALVVATALFGRDEPRVYEGARDWCARNGAVVNVARLKTVAGEIGGDPAALAEFAALVTGAGGPRWPVAGGLSVPHQARERVRAPDLRAPVLLAWRLRSAFGVAARADILVVLATTPDQAYPLADLARLTRSTKRNVALAVRALAMAGLIDVDRAGNEQRVRLTRHVGLRDWLGPAPAPPVDWTARFAVVVAVLGFEVAAASPVVRAIEARALVERLRPAIRRAALPEPDTARLGEAFAVAFDVWREELAAAVRP
jgi:DNA-binding transcriptional ArsR family regulator